MASEENTPLDRARPGRRYRAFAFVTYAFVIVMLGTTMPTPLYSIYQQRLGFSELMVTVIFAAYAAGVIAALIAFGRWADQLGRRPVLLGAIGCAFASSIAFLFGGLPGLLVGRVLSGLSAGIFTGSATVMVIELAPQRMRQRATLVATAANMGGLGLGPVTAGLLAQYAPWPLHLCFALYLGALVLAAAGVWYAPETTRAAQSPDLAPQRLQLPAQVRSVFVPAAIGGFAGFAVLGLFTAVAPAVLGTLLHVSNHALVGLVVLVLFVASTAGQLALTWIPRQRALILGCLVLALGAGVIAAGVGLERLSVLLTGAVLAGLGQGLSFRAGLVAISDASPRERRSEVTSTFFVVLYVAISIPVIGVGLASQLLGLRIAGIGFSGFIALLALTALLALAYRRRHSHAVS